MKTEAQKRARDKYERNNVKRFNMAFYPTESDIYAWLGQQTNKQGYVKDLIRKDMEQRNEFKEN